MSGRYSDVSVNRGRRKVRDADGEALWRRQWLHAKLYFCLHSFPTAAADISGTGLQERLHRHECHCTLCCIVCLQRNCAQSFQFAVCVRVCVCNENLYFWDMCVSVFNCSFSLCKFFMFVFTLCCLWVRLYCSECEMLDPVIQILILIQILIHTIYSYRDLTHLTSHPKTSLFQHPPWYIFIQSDRMKVGVTSWHIWQTFHIHVVSE